MTATQGGHYFLWRYMFRIGYIIAAFFLFVKSSNGQGFKFAQVSDTHVGGSTGAQDLRLTVQDLNQQKDIDFVVFTGDITEFGSDEELKLAKQILDSLNLPWHIIPGNHDSNWSESGANSFRKVFGGETFFFRHKGFMFMGTVSGPNMRMSPGQIPRENIVWMDSVFAANPDVHTPLIFINHYPLDNGLNNWYEAVDRIKDRNIQFAMCGHGHQNRLYDWDGIPGVMGRSNLRAKEAIGAYNIISIDSQKAVYTTRRPLSHTEDAWLEVPLKNNGFENNKLGYPRPDFSVNQQYLKEKSVAWEYEDTSDLGAGFGVYKKLVITGNTQGKIYALQLKTGKKVWENTTGGKIYSTPVVWKNTVVVGSSDHFIYGFSAKNGSLKWKFETGKAVLGSPIVHEGVAFIGGSDGNFRAIDVESGAVKWTFDQVSGYVSGKPLLYQNKLYFGSWSNGFYALNPENGALIWQWKNTSPSRMYSAAACYPVGANNRVFIVAPDRLMTAFDAETGDVIWREKRDSVRVRESMGLSVDEKQVYVKTMDGNLYGVSTTSNRMDLTWKSALQLPYEISPTHIESKENLVFVPSNSGLLSAVNANSGKVFWQYKISNAMINPILTHKKGLIVSTMDGKIVNIKTRFK
jgi:outer membrane protein assembly factor BamB/Icc-related predicted phosphoesterase